MHFFNIFCLFFLGILMFLFALLYVVFQINFWKIWQEKTKSPVWLMVIGCVCCILACFVICWWAFSGLSFALWLTFTAMVVLITQFCTCKKVWQKMHWTFWYGFQKWHMLAIQICAFVLVYVWRTLFNQF